MRLLEKYKYYKRASVSKAGIKKNLEMFFKKRAYIKAFLLMIKEVNLNALILKG